MELFRVNRLDSTHWFKWHESCFWSCNFRNFSIRSIHKKLWLSRPCKWPYLQNKDFWWKHYLMPFVAKHHDLWYSYFALRNIFNSSGIRKQHICKLKLVQIWHFIRNDHSVGHLWRLRLVHNNCTVCKFKWMDYRGHKCTKFSCQQKYQSHEIRLKLQHSFWQRPELCAFFSSKYILVWPSIHQVCKWLDINHLHYLIWSWSSFCQIRLNKWKYIVNKS